MHKITFPKRTILDRTRPYQTVPDHITTVPDRKILFFTLYLKIFVEHNIANFNFKNYIIKSKNMKIDVKY
jgi:hypothetical protein